MKNKISIGVDPFTGDIQIGLACEIQPGLFMFTGTAQIVTDRAFHCVAENCSITKTSEYHGMIGGKKFTLTYMEEDE